MQPAVSVPRRGAIAAALALTTAVLVVPPEHALATIGSAIASRLAAVDAMTRAALFGSEPVDESWHHANYLAWVIEHRRYGEIEAAAAAVPRGSSYAPWVPAAVDLAIEQLDATAAAYARMRMCRDLSRFLVRVDVAWPQGREGMRPVACDAIAPDGFAPDAIVRDGLARDGFSPARAYQRAARVQRLQQRAVHFADLRAAVATADHARALASCAAFGGDGPPPAVCLAVACRAGELAVAEVLLPHGDAVALRACARAGVTFVGGVARAAGVTNPTDLVHVHPDAPPRLDHPGHASWLSQW